MNTHGILPILLLIAACRAATRAVPPSTEHPAHPAAATTPPPSRRDPFSLMPTFAPPGIETSAAPAPGMNHPQPTEAGEPAGEPTYHCPMHPEVVSGEPGICPECGMQLQPARVHGHGEAEDER